MFYWLALNYVQGIGSIKYKALISHFKSPDEIFKADSVELCKVDGIGKKLADAIVRFDDFKAVEAELEKAERGNINIIKYLDYPSRLREVNDAPPILYIKGELSESDENAFSIVGARSASVENLAFAEEIGSKIASRGVTVVSGMALGIDSAAHRGALKSGGRTIAVLGSGVDVCYPYSSKDLYDRIADTGAVISEFRLGTAPNRENFPKRNRIISGMSKGLLVVEANTDSGSLITANCAIKQRRKLFAVPGDIRKSKAKGTNSLIKKGALLVDCEKDIFDNISFDRKILEGRAIKGVYQAAAQKHDLTDNERELFLIINEEAKHIDDIIKESSLGTSQVSGTLLNLELKGYIKQYSGKMFVRMS